MDVQKRRWLVASAVLMAILATEAKTTKWIGGSSGTLSDSTWDNGAPAVGDVVQFDKEVTLSGSFDMGTGTVGLTVENSAKLTFGVVLTGTGSLVKNGAGDLEFNYGKDIGKNKNYFGNIIVNAGSLTSNTRDDVCTFGNGKIVLNRNDDLSPRLVHFPYSGSITNDVEIHGAIPGNANYSALTISQTGKLTGAVTGDDDISLRASYRKATVQGAVTVPEGKSINLLVDNVNSADVGNPNNFTTLVLKGRLSGNVRRPSYNNYRLGYTEFYGEQGRPTDELFIGVGTNTLQATARWRGQSVRIEAGVNFAALLALTDNANLSARTVLEISNTGDKKLAKLSIAKNVKATVSRLKIQGVEQSAGIYTSADLPDYLIGEGVLEVLGKTVNEWIGPANGKWSETQNWSLGHAPLAGEVLGFAGGVTLDEETVELGAGDWIVRNEKAVTNKTTFTGAGRFVKMGAGEWTSQALNTYTGGTVVREGYVLAFGTEDNQKNILGSGAITIQGDGLSAQGITLGRWNANYTCGLNIEGAVTNETRGAIYNSNLTTVESPIVGTDDFVIRSHFGNLIVNGNIALPEGKVVTFIVEKDEAANKVNLQRNPVVYLKGAVNASVVKKGPGRLFMSGVQTRTTDSLTVLAGTNVLETTCVWAGRRVAVEGATTCLKLTANENLSTDAIVSVSNGGKLDIAANVCVRVKNLLVNGVALPSGSYAASDLSGTITGEGRLTVGIPGFVVIVRGDRESSENDR